ncbi:MAG: electron transfer flavoprotein subunit alpha/FixB family protein [Candidatus Thermoplasmatota archaeon]|nr:electron transfer flavoprotein subunit alpha/FixB family protein [Candidatus Thermoplasmatota archaeon]
MVMIFSDVRKNGLELLAKGKEMAEAKGTKLSAVLVGPSTTFADDYVKHGADRIFTAGKDMEEAKAEETTEILETIIREEGEDIILIASTKVGKELAPRLAARLDAGCASDSNKLYLQDGALVSERVVYSGNGIAKEKFISYPAVVTIPAKAYDPLPADDSRSGEIIDKDITPTEYGSKTTNIQKMVSEGVNVEDAEVIVSCGRGFKNSDDLKLIEELASILHGNALGCSRPIAADLKWLSEDHWIGLSGHKVKPKLYIACGISGQIQHVAGMRDAGTIVAINKDADAPIFNSADYGIVGDIYKVIPMLIDAIKEKL